MHRDVKLGLALGILVIGFAAAFCFPRQPATDVAINPAAGLKLAAIDDEIRLERRRTFVGDELNPPPQPTLAEPATEAVVQNGLPPLQTPAMRAQALQRSAPEPIRREVPLPLDEPLLAAEGVPPVVETVVVEPPVEEQIYVVQSGDTLSAVASKTLGSSRKYEMIYEANRDILATPNSLQIGMQLRIPQPAESIARRTTPAPAAVQTSVDSSIPASRMAAREVPEAGAVDAMPRGRLFSPVAPRSRHAASGDVIPR
jgi:LysM repeat protein